MNATVKPVTSDALQKARTNLEGWTSKVRESLPGWAQKNQAGIIVGGALLVAGLAALLFFTGPNNSNLRPLYGRQEIYDVPAVMERLDAERISYQVHAESGQVLVPVADLAHARMALATGGITPSLPAGMELLSADGQLGRSQFVERAQYLSGLQGEIEQTIMSLRSVRAARVHIAVPERTAFLRDQVKPTASVYLDLFPGAVLDQKQVQGIMSLVAGGFPNLDAGDVVILDQNSNPLNGAEQEGFQELDKQLEYTRRVEREYVQRITRLLEPLVGAGNLRVAVNVDMDFSYQEVSTEGFAPESAVVRSESFSGVQEPVVASGVPGVEANQTVEDPSDNDGRSVSQIRNYEVDRTVSYRRQDGFNLSKVNVAVVLNSGIDGFSGEEAAVQLTAVRELLLSAAGIESSRGDEIAVQALPFVSEIELRTPEDLLLGTEGGQGRIVLMLLGLLVLIVVAGSVFFWLRRRSELKQKEEMTREIAMLAGRDGAEISGENGSDVEFRSADRVRDLSRSNPEQVAGILERWIKEGDQ